MMPYCCGYHHHHHHCWSPWDWDEESYPPYPRRYAGPPREGYVRRLEEEREMMERRLRRLEQELEELRQQRRSPQE
jgi:hypothetical protein